jgi:hypothetical protein
VPPALPSPACPNLTPTPTAALHDLVINKASFRAGETPEEAAERLAAEKAAKEAEKKDKAEKAREAEKERKARARFGGTGEKKE